MPCTTILVGKKASYNGATIIARNDDSGAGHFTPKKYVVIHPEEQPTIYQSVLSHVKIELPEHPMRYTAMPNAVDGEGVWAACGVNEAKVAMTATETITSNPYIHSAREGVIRLGSLLEQYGTYEMNGIAFQDKDEIWWLETIGGHHWMAGRVPDDVYVVMPNQLGLDTFDLEDALTTQKDYMCSKDLQEFIEENHLNLSLDGSLNPRDAFGSHDDSDHVYNTPRAWFMERYLNPHTYKWDGEQADYTPASDDIPWCLKPEKKVTIEDVKYVLSAHFQGTPYDPYGSYGEKSMKGAFRSIGVNRNDFLSVIEMRPEQADITENTGSIIQWVAFASNVFNVLVPFYGEVETTPEYVSNTTGEVSTDNFYWASRMIAAMADASYHRSLFHIERYQMHVMAKGRELLHTYDALLAEETDAADRQKLMQQANNAIAEMLKKETQDTLDKVLFELSSQMKNAYSRSDA